MHASFFREREGVMWRDERFLELGLGLLAAYPSYRVFGSPSLPPQSSSAWFAHTPELYTAICST